MLHVVEMLLNDDKMNNLQKHQQMTTNLSKGPKVALPITELMDANWNVNNIIALFVSITYH